MAPIKHLLLDDEISQLNLLIQSVNGAMKTAFITHLPEQILLNV